MAWVTLKHIVTSTMMVVVMTSLCSTSLLKRHRRKSKDLRQDVRKGVSVSQDEGDSIDLSKLPILKKFTSRDKTDSKPDTKRVVNGQIQGEGTNTSPDNVLLDTVYESIGETNDTQHTSNHTSYHNTSRLTCPHCYARESVVNMRIKWLKSYILDALNLDKPPNVTGQVLPDKTVLNRLKRKLDQEARAMNKARSQYDDMEDSIQRISIIRPKQVAETKVLWGKVRDRKSTNVFLLTDDVTSENIKSASLNVHIVPPRNINKTYIDHLWIAVYRLTEQDNSIFPSFEGHFKVKGHHKSKLKRGSAIWMKMTLTDQIRDMASMPGGRTIGFEPRAIIKDSDGDGKILNIISKFTGRQNEEQYLPFLEIHRLPQRRRTRRSTPDNMICEDTDTEVNCCRYPLVVEFQEFNWDFIISPKRYNANYCQGECTMVLRRGGLEETLYNLSLNSRMTPHTHFTSQFDPNEASPCCSPLKFESQSLIYFDESKEIKIENIPHMTAVECGCV